MFDDVFEDDEEDWSLLERISINPAVMVGKPVIRGTRIPVVRVLQHLEENDWADVFRAFPELVEDDVRACLAYARAALEREYDQVRAERRREEFAATSAIA